MDANKILDFWFDELKPAQWFAKDAELDKKIQEKFGDIHGKVAAGETFGWRESARGRLAEVIVLDQFSRNIYRGRPQSFAFDGMALLLAQEVIRKGQDEDLSVPKRAFLYMPFMHSESLTIHRWGLELYQAQGLEYYLEFEKKHMAIIQKFGRYPHRNEILGRESTQAELDFLKEDGSSF